MLELNQVFETDQGTVRYGVMGEGDPIILVHGTPWSSYTWHKLASTLAQKYRVYYYDLIGYGQSEMKLEQSVSLDIQSQIFTDLIKHWGVDDPTVIAHDFGGAISLRGHILHGLNYHKLVLMNVVALAPWGSPFFAHVQEHEAAFAGVPEYIHKAILERYIQGALFNKTNLEMLNELTKPWLGQTGQAAFYRQIAQADQKYTDEIEANYGDITFPVQIIWGKNDDWIPIDIGRRLHDSIPHSEFHAIADAGHLVQLDQANLVAKHIQNFLA